MHKQHPFVVIDEKTLPKAFWSRCKRKTFFALKLLRGTAGLASLFYHGLQLTREAFDMIIDIFF